MKNDRAAQRRMQRPPADLVAALRNRALRCMPAPQCMRLHHDELFRQYLEQATEAARLKFMSCARCPQPTRGAIGVPGIGWLCRDHYRELIEGGAARMGFQKPKPINEVKPWQVP